MYQLVSIFFDNNDFSFKFEVQFKPLKAFMIIFDCMISSSKSDRVDYISTIHEYLAKYTLMVHFFLLKFKANYFYSSKETAFAG